MNEENVVEQGVLMYYPERCTGCKYCEIVCSFLHFDVIDLNKAHIRTVFNAETGEFEAVVCQHCEDPVCAASCPVDAITKDEKTGWVKIDPLKCVGCKNCNYACPLSIPWFDKEHRVSAKCDFCDPIRNGKPICVEFCSPKALEVIPRAKAWALYGKMYGEEGGK